jgi:hypothetical protein
MKHASTRKLFEHWNERRGSRPAPERADIDPAGIRHALGDTFMLAADFVDQLRFRLAGTRVCALFCREIKGEAFLSLWDEQGRAQIDEIAALVMHEAAGVVAGVTGTAADGAATELELLLLPLAHIGHARIRAVGALTPLDPPYWLGEKPLAALTLGSVRHVGPEAERFSSPGGQFPDPAGVRVRHGFVVYSGGREG